ncbi:phage major capsid protein [Curtobacterium sp. Csp1]|uniref:phage major capsid protein n=1 Tax=Curtobacterium sp. Csp1 TaxID=2495429 RepID=UPI001C2EB2A5|nr:phage major capsid protein [Curtobacterium sp. Csp1]
MGLKAQLAALVSEMQSIVDTAKAAGRDLDAEEAKSIEAKAAEAGELRDRIARIEAGEKSLAELSKVVTEPGKTGDAERGDEDGTEVPLGERFMKSAPYQAWKKENPSGVGQGTPIQIGTVRIGSLKDFDANRKALTSPIANIQPIRVPTVDQVQRPTLSLLDVVSRGTAAGNFEYVQVTSVTRNAKIVPEATSATDNAALKPVSDLTTTLADAKAYTYADGYDATNQLLADAPAFASYMDNELRYSLDSVIEDTLLNGSGTNGIPKGILNTTGVQEQEYATADGPMGFVKAVRRAITKVTQLQGGTVAAILLNPEDDENIDLLQDANERFYGQGPFGTGPQTLWGRPRILSEAIEPGEFLLGDFRQVALLDREGLSVQAFNQHKDYAQRNMTYVRAELRAMQVIWKPAYLVHGGPAA